MFHALCLISITYLWGILKWKMEMNHIAGAGYRWIRTSIFLLYFSAHLHW